MTWRGNGYYSSETPEYRAISRHHHQANALYSSVCASGTTYAAWVAAPEHLERYQRNVVAQKLVRCEWPVSACMAGCTAKHLTGDAETAVAA